MAALTETALNVTSFEGKYKVAVVNVTGATGTTGTVTIDEMSQIIAVSGQLTSAPTAACGYVYASPNATTATNVVSVVLYKADLVNTCTQTATDAQLIVVGF